MKLPNAIAWSPPPEWDRITVIDSHTGGEPFRIVLEGIPDVPGGSMVEKRRYAMENLDHYRRLLMWEPRGHADMYGALLGPPAEPDSDISVLFIHNEGFSTMCGHGIIALTKVALDTGILPTESKQTTIRIDTPAGQVKAVASTGTDGVESVRFANVPSFAADLDASVDVAGLGTVNYDLAFGGAFYAYVDAAEADVDLSDSPTLIAKGRQIKQAVIASRDVEHPFESELSFLYGVIFIGPAVDPEHHSRNVCVFADGEIDRSPTGTGVSGRLAIGHARGDIAQGQDLAVESIVGSVFRGRWVEETSFGPYPAVIPEIAGTAHITGRSEFWMDPDDTLGRGFLL